MNGFTIEPMASAEAESILRIYAEGIAGRIATFETELPSWETFDAGKRPDCRLAAHDTDGTLLGWAVLSPVSKRPAYNGVAEVSIYVASAAHGRGIGTALMSALIAASEEAGIWTLTASIFPENKASITLHQKAGFVILGRRDRIARLDGIWRDTLLLERRSPIVGLQ